MSRYPSCRIPSLPAKAALALLVLLAGCAGVGDGEPLRRIHIQPAELSLDPPRPPDLAALRKAFSAKRAPRGSPGRASFRPIGILSFLNPRIRAEVEARLSARGRRAEVLAVEAGIWDLPALAEKLADPRLVCEGRRCLLAAPLFVARGATLVLRDRTLEMEASSGALLAVAGGLFLDRATVRGLEGGRPARFRAPGRFRPFLAVYEGGSAFIRRSRIQDLGYAAPLAYGLSFGRAVRNPPNLLPPPTGVVFRSRIEGLYYAFYSHRAEDVVLLDNRVLDSIRYGIDPHDDSRRLIIAGNRVSNTRERHGIILSRRVVDSWILDNVSETNGGSGIVLDRWSDRNVVAGNVVRANRRDGISVFESGRLWLVANRVEDNESAGIRVRNGTEVVLVANRIRNNRGDGLSAYTGPAPRTEAEGWVVRRTSLLLQDNLLRDNERADVRLRGRLSALFIKGRADRHPLSATAHPPRLRAPEPWMRALADLPPGFTGWLFAEDDLPPAVPPAPGS